MHSLLKETIRMYAGGILKGPIWFATSGGLFIGHVFTSAESFAEKFYSQDINEQLKDVIIAPLAPSDDECIFLEDLKLIKDNQVINIKAAIIRLDEVAAWGIGDPTQSG